MPRRSRTVGVQPVTTGGSSFVGRKAEVAEAAKLLLRRRLVTFTGAPGVGKSRLAAEVTKRIRSSLKTGAVVVDLESVSEAARVGPALAAAFDGREPATGRSALRSLPSGRGRRGRPSEAVELFVDRAGKLQQDNPPARNAVLAVARPGGNRSLPQGGATKGGRGPPSTRGAPPSLIAPAPQVDKSLVEASTTARKARDSAERRPAAHKASALARTARDARRCRDSGDRAGVGPVVGTGVRGQESRSGCLGRVSSSLASAPAAHDERAESLHHQAVELRRDIGDALTEA